MAQKQTELQATRSVLAELAGSEQALADFEVQQKQSPAYWRYMTKCYKQTRGLKDEDGSDTNVKGAGPDEVAGDNAVTVQAATDKSSKQDDDGALSGKKRGTIGQPSSQSHTASARH